MKKAIIIFLHVWQLVLYLGVVCATILWFVELNVFNWHPKISFAAIACPVGVIVLGLLVYYNSRKINRKFGFYLNIIMCFFILYYGWGLTLEEIEATGWLRRSILSPLWFRMSQIIMLLVPVVAFAATKKEKNQPNKVCR